MWNEDRGGREREKEREKVGTGDRDKKWGVEGGLEGLGRGAFKEERDKRVFCVYSHRVAARNFRPHK